MTEPGGERVDSANLRPPPAPPWRDMALVAKRRKVQRRGCLMLAGVMALAILAVPIAFLVADRSGMRYHETPRQVQGLSGVTAVASGSNHSLALKSDGSVWAWGQNYNGELGIGTNKNQSRPQRVPLPRPATAIAASSDASFAVTDDGAVWAWGYNLWGVLGTSAIPAICYPQRGIRSTSVSVSPVRVENLSGVTTIAAGDEHVLAVTSEGEVLGWGNSTRSQVGPHGTRCAEGYRDQFTRLPARIEMPGRVTAVAAGYDHSLALLEDGRMWGWGGNDAGQSGFQRGGMTFHVQGISDAAAIAGGEFVSLAALSDGTVRFWGRGWGSETCQFTHDGVARTAPCSKVPVLLAGLPSAAAVTEQWIVGTDGQLWSWSWGAAASSGGIYTTTPSVHRFALNEVRMVTARSWGHHLALRNDGTVWSWGLNGSGQLGN